MAGPSDTPFEGGVFRALLKFPHDYPMSPVCLQHAARTHVSCRNELTSVIHFVVRAAEDDIYNSSVASKHLWDRRGTVCSILM